MNHQFHWSDYGFRKSSGSLRCSWGSDSSATASKNEPQAV